LNKLFIPIKIIIVLLIIDLVTAQPIIIAHRGAMGYAPENTLAAFKLAIELGADAIELDLRQTKDGVPVALHNATLNKTTNAQGNVKNFNFDELQKLDAGSWFDEKYQKEKIPSLQEVINLLNDSVVIIIELKDGNETYPGIEEKTVSLIRENRIESQTILKSFDPNVLSRLRKIAPEIPLCYVYALRIPWLGMIIDQGVTFGSIFSIDAEYLQPHRFFLSESFVKDAQSKGYKIISWGVNSEEAIKQSIYYNVDGIETDYPDRVKKLISEY
jgi:glycerophosphoryl diester phosphodiesterase